MLRRILNCASRSFSSVSAEGSVDDGLLKRMTSKSLRIVRSEGREEKSREQPEWESLSERPRQPMFKRPQRRDGDGGFSPTFRRSPNFSGRSAESTRRSSSYSERPSESNSSFRRSSSFSERPSESSPTFRRSPNYSSDEPRRSFGDRNNSEWKPRSNSSFRSRDEPSSESSTISRKGNFNNYRERDQSSPRGYNSNSSYRKPYETSNNSRRDYGERSVRSSEIGSERPTYWRSEAKTERWNSSSDRKPFRRNDSDGEGQRFYKKSYDNNNRSFRSRDECDRPRFGEGREERKPPSESALIRANADNHTAAIRLKGISIRHGAAQVMSAFTSYLDIRKKQQQQLQENERPNLPLFNTAIDLLSQGGNFQDCLNLTVRMQRDWSVEPNEMTVCSLLSALGEKMSKKDVPRNHAETYKMILDKYWQGKKIEDNIFIFNAALKYLGRSDLDAMLAMFPPKPLDKSNIETAVVGDICTYTTCIESLSRSNRPEMALEYHRNLPSELKPDATYYKAILYALISAVHANKPSSSVYEEMMDIIRAASTTVEYQTKTKGVHALVLSALRKLNEHELTLEHYQERVTPMMNKSNLDVQCVSLYLRSLVHLGRFVECFKTVDYLKAEFEYKPDAKGLTAMMEAAALQKSATKAEELLNGYIKTGQVVLFGPRLPFWYIRAIQESGLPEEEIDTRVKKMKTWCQEKHPAVHLELETMLLNPAQYT